MAVDIIMTADRLMDDLRKAFMQQDIKRVRALLHLLGICAGDLENVDQSKSGGFVYSEGPPKVQAESV